MEYVEDKNLSAKQQKLKWYLYCEVDLEEASDVKAVLKSLLNDFEGVK